MKLLLVCFAMLSLSLFSCKKLVEENKKELFFDIVTNGQWHVESYLEGTNNITEVFQGYNFQFLEDGTVTGMKDVQSTPGTWSGDLSNYAISSNFPDASDPLKKLNGTWIIKDSATDFVKAEMTAGQVKMILLLRKNQ